jgi:hypothetical protein
MTIFFWRYSPHCTRASLFTRFLDHAPQSVGLIRTSDRPVAQTSDNTQQSEQTDIHTCPPVGFKPTISAGERPQTYALDRAGTETGITRQQNASFHAVIASYTLLRTEHAHHLTKLSATPGGMQEVGMEM